MADLQPETIVKSRTAASFERVALGVAAGILLVVKLFEVPDNTERGLMWTFGVLLIVLLARLIWDFFKLASEVASTIGHARSVVRDMRAREIALGRNPDTEAPPRRGLWLRVAHWFLTADMPWQRR